MFEIILKEPARKFLKKLDKKSALEITRKLKNLKTNPSLGVPLTGSLTGLWKPRVGKFRAVYKIENNELIVL